MAFKKKRIIPEEQCGFVKDHSLIYHSVKIEIKLNCDFFFDIEKD